MKAKIAFKIRYKSPPLFWAHKISPDLEIQRPLLAAKTKLVKKETNLGYFRTKTNQNRGRVCLLESLSTFLSKDNLAKNVSSFH